MSRTLWKCPECGSGPMPLTEHAFDCGTFESPDRSISRSAQCRIRELEAEVDRLRASREPEWNRVFQCPKCKGTFFGTLFDDYTNLTGPTYHCHDQYGVGCRWVGRDDAECFVEVAQRPIQQPEPTEGKVPA